MPRSVTTVLLLICGAAFYPGEALAVQSHGGAEGLVSHQLGHFLFLCGASFLLYHTYQDRLAGQGWGFFSTFLWLMIAWNIMAFTGHQLHELSYFQEAKADGLHLSLSDYEVKGPLSLIFYLAHLDHLVLVPAFCCLVTALGRWERGR